MSVGKQHPLSIQWDQTVVVMQSSLLPVTLFLAVIEGIFVSATFSVLTI